MLESVRVYVCERECVCIYVCEREYVCIYMCESLCVLKRERERERERREKREDITHLENVTNLFLN